MFCKWCGETIDAVDVRCPKCGRDTPPMSDCGGFYKLKTGVEAGGAVPQPSGPVKLPQLDKLGKMYVRDVRQNRIMQVLSLGVSLIAIVLLVATLISVITMGAKLDAVNDDAGSKVPQGQNIIGQKNDDDNQGEEGTTASGDAAQDGTEPEQTISAEQGLEDMELELVVEKRKNENGNTRVFGKAWANTDAGNVVSWVHTRVSGPSIGADVDYVLENTGDLLQVKLVAAVSGISVGCDTDGDLFGGYDFESLTWEYRLWADGEWTACTDESDDQEIDLQKDWVTEVLDDADRMELRCVLTLKNAAGKAIRVTITGLQYGEDGILFVEDLPDEPGVTSGSGISSSVS